MTQCDWKDRSRLDALLLDSWEPFAVTDDGYGAQTVWLRRSVYTSDAGVEPEPRRHLDAAV
jgi:hypothetical protein